MEVAVSCDRRSSPEAQSLKHEADIWIDAEHDYASAGINALLAAATRRWAFWVSDDEEPGAALWKIASKPPYPLAYRVLMLCPVGKDRHYQRGMERQIRLFPRESYHWDGDVNGDPVISVGRADLPNTVLWHYAHTAPLTEREAKERHARDVVGDGTSYRFMPERFPDQIVPMEDVWRSQLPR